MFASSVAELQVVFEEQQVDLNPIDKKVARKPAQQLVLRIGTDYFYIIRDGQITAYDFAQGKIMRYKDSNKISESPFEAVVAERLEGFLQEVEIFRIMSNANALKERDRFGIFNLESKYALQTDIHSAVKPAKTPAGSKKYAYTLNSDMVVTYQVSKEQLIRQEVAYFERFLLYECRIHPEVRKDILAYRKVPQTLIYRYGLGHDRRETTLTMLSAKRIRDTVFTDEMRDGSRPPIGDLEKLFVSAVENVAENALNPNDYRRMFTSSLRQSYFLDAMLTNVELYLQTGSSISRAVELLKPQLDIAPNLDRFFSGLDTNTPEAAAESLRQLKEIDRTNVFRQHIIDISMANALRETDQYVAAEKHYLEALRSNPYLTGVYVDLGDLYYRMNLMPKAWSAWQMAQDLLPGHPMLDTVFERNAFLRERFPEYF